MTHTSSDLWYCPIARAAQTLQCHAQTLRRWVQQNRVRSLRTPRGVEVCIDDLPLPPAIKDKLRAEAQQRWAAV